MYLSYQEISNVVKKEKEKYTELSKTDGVQAEHLRSICFHRMRAVVELEKELNMVFKKKYNI